MTTELERKWFGKVGYPVRDDDVTESFKVTASPKVMERFKRFLTFLAYNDGHSGIFGLYFDGDGSDFCGSNPNWTGNTPKGCMPSAALGQM